MDIWIKKFIIENTDLTDEEVIHLDNLLTTYSLTTQMAFENVRENGLQKLINLLNSFDIQTMTEKEWLYSKYFLKHIVQSNELMEEKQTNFDSIAIPGNDSKPEITLPPELLMFLKMNEEDLANDRFHFVISRIPDLLIRGLNDLKLRIDQEYYKIHGRYNFGPYNTSSNRDLIHEIVRKDQYIGTMVDRKIYDELVNQEKNRFEDLLSQYKSWAEDNKCVKHTKTIMSLFLKSINCQLTANTVNEMLQRLKHE